MSFSTLAVRNLFVKICREFFLGASICFIKFFQRIERLLKNERLVCRDCKKFLALTSLINGHVTYSFQEVNSILPADFHVID